MSFGSEPQTGAKKVLKKVSVTTPSGPAMQPQPHKELLLANTCVNIKSVQTCFGRSRDRQHACGALTPGLHHVFWGFSALIGGDQEIYFQICSDISFSTW